jgi:hypothetical protein
MVYVIPWINKANLALYIARIMRTALNQSEVSWKLYCAIEFVAVIEVP